MIRFLIRRQNSAKRTEREVQQEVKGAETLNSEHTQHYTCCAAKSITVLIKSGPKVNQFAGIEHGEKLSDKV